MPRVRMGNSRKETKNPAYLAWFFVWQLTVLAHLSNLEKDPSLTKGGIHEIHETIFTE